MAKDIFSAEVKQTIRRYQQAGRRPTTRIVAVDNEAKSFLHPFPSPGDWRDHWIYFLLIDRFNNPARAPVARWDDKFDFRQGGSFKGVQQQLGYIADLGARAIWLSPVLKNSRPSGFRFNYHGYAAQDFLNLDERLASDGTLATAEREFAELVDEAHARGLHVILDIVINHAGRVFDYVRGGEVVDSFSDQSVMDAALGQEPSIQWLNGFGFPRADWLDNLPDAAQLSPDDAVWPADLQRREFFRRRGSKLSDEAPPGGFARGDFGSMRQLVAEYDACVPGQEALREKYGKTPVLGILIAAHQYLMAKYDLDGYRIDTVKYVDPQIVEVFGNAMREFALSAGKRNFFTFGEIYDDEQTIARFVGRNSTVAEGFGIDAALDFPLFFALPQVVKARRGVESIRRIFRERREVERELLSSHGEAGRYFVSFLDNHDQNERFNHPETPSDQITMGIALLFTLQGIPCLYYGTEQGLDGTKDTQGGAVLDAHESVREALWGRANAFDRAHPLYAHVKDLSTMKDDEPGLRYGRIYFREVSGNGQDFGHSQGVGGVVAYSRILTDREILVVANTSAERRFDGLVVVDMDLSRVQRRMRVAYSNRRTPGTGTVQMIAQARFHEEGAVRTGPAAALFVGLAPMEVQILVPES